MGSCGHYSDLFGPVRFFVFSSGQSQLELARRVKDERSAEALAAKRNAADLEQKVRYCFTLTFVWKWVVDFVLMDYSSMSVVLPSSPDYMI